MYKNVKIDLKPRPVLQELIEDLTNKMLNLKKVLADCYQGDVWHQEKHDLCKGLESDIQLLNDVIERCYAQQELINIRDEQIIGLN